MATAGTTSTPPAASSTDGLHLLGCRHHGPGSARSVRRALDALRPAIVLVELPADAAPLLGWVADDRLVPPVALLATPKEPRGWSPARGPAGGGQGRSAALWPLADFSPEWQAIRWAHDHDVEVRPIDVPAGWLLSRHADDRSEQIVEAAAGQDVAERPDPLAALAAAAGEPDAERWWEDVVEHRGDGVPAFGAVAAAMAAVREGDESSLAGATPGDASRIDPSRIEPSSIDPSRIENVREAHMRRAIRTARRDAGDRGVAVVCGAWHVPALDPAVSTATADNAAVAGVGRNKAVITWVPWSDERLQRRGGYHAGVAHPGWYRHVFRHPGSDGVARFFVSAGAALRRHGLAASPDHLIGASRLADGLAALRGRPRAGLAEVLDAAGAVMAAGEPPGSGIAGLGTVAGVLAGLTVGDTVGAVPADAPQAPLVRDVTAAQRTARLKPETNERTVELDLRSEGGRRRSRLLHRLAALGVGWGRLTDGRGTRGTFRETWTIRWDPAMAVRLVECSSYGVTLVDAATAFVVERATTTERLPTAAALVRTALVADLPDAVERCAVALGRLAARDPDVAELIDALPPLAGALRYGDVRRSSADGLSRVVDEIVVRVIAGLDIACRSLDDEAAAAMVERLAALQGALATIDHPARRDQLPLALARIADRRGVHGAVRGRATRLLHDAGAWPPEEVSRRVGRALGAGTTAADGARFIEGFLAGSGTVLVHDAALLAVVDDWISSLSHEWFADTVALLRRTFGAFEPAERRQLGVLVGGPLRPSPTGAAGETDELDADRVARAMETVRALLGLPESDR